MCIQKSTRSGKKKVSVYDIFAKIFPHIAFLHLYKHLRVCVKPGVEWQSSLKKLPMYLAQYRWLAIRLFFLQKKFYI